MVQRSVDKVVSDSYAKVVVHLACNFHSPILLLNFKVFPSQSFNGNKLVPKFLTQSRFSPVPPSGSGCLVFSLTEYLTLFLKHIHVLYMYTHYMCMLVEVSKMSSKGRTILPKQAFDYNNTHF